MFTENVEKGSGNLLVGTWNCNHLHTSSRSSCLCFGRSAKTCSSTALNSQSRTNQNGLQVEGRSKGGRYIGAMALKTLQQQGRSFRLVPGRANLSIMSGSGRQARILCALWSCVCGRQNWGNKQIIGNRSRSGGGVDYKGSLGWGTLEEGLLNQL